MLTFAAVFKFLWENKLMVIAPGWAALAAVGYIHVFEMTGLKDGLQSLQVSQLEEKLDTVYTALCMNPGDPGILERIRELQQAYEKVATKRYDAPDCDLLLKIK